MVHMKKTFGGKATIFAQNVFTKYGLLTEELEEDIFLRKGNAFSVSERIWR